MLWRECLGSGRLARAVAEERPAEPSSPVCVYTCVHKGPLVNASQWKTLLGRQRLSRELPHTTHLGALVG